MPIQKIIARLVFALILAVLPISASFAFQLKGDAKIVMLIRSNKDDGGWSQSFDEARVRMQDDMNVNIRALYNVSDDPAVLQSLVEKLIGDKYNIIVGTALGYSDVFKVLAAKHPDVAFLNAAGSTNASNLESFYPRTYESLFLCGMAAGAVSKSGKLGYVATVRRGLVHWAVSAYELGAREMNPDAEVTIVYTGPQPGDAKIRAATLALIKDGADVVGELAGSPTPQIVAQENGVFATGYHRDLRDFAPMATQCTSVSAWDRFLEPEFEKIAHGTWAPSAAGAFLSIKEGAMDVVCCGSAVPQPAVDRILAVRQEMIDGKRQVYAGPLNDREGKERVVAGQVLGDAELWAMDWYVKGVTDQN